jgi:hypothetical protein
MKKTHKKIDNAICLVLTQLCETKLKKIDGFQWITHTVNYNQFPTSLQVSCIFDSEASLATINKAPLRQAIQQQLAKLDIAIPPQQISFDTQ